MNSPGDLTKDRAANAMGRREFLQAAAAAVSSRYLRAQSSNPRSVPTRKPAAGATRARVMNAAFQLTAHPEIAQILGK